MIRFHYPIDVCVVSSSRAVGHVGVMMRLLLSQGQCRAPLPTQPTYYIPGAGRISLRVSDNSRSYFSFYSFSF